MTESEWLTSEDPARMIEYLEAMNSAVSVGQSPYPVPHTSDRKLRLFACACVREHWRLLGAECRRAVETAEAFADGEATKEETFRLASSRMTIARCLMPTWDSSEEATAVIETARMHNTALLPAYVCLLREVVGNPHRPVREGQSDLEPMVVFGPHVFPKRWLTPAVVEMAAHAYDARNFAGLPILADALEEAGCDNEQVLRHLRGEELVPSPHMPKLGLWGPRRGPHVLGCWVLDLLLGKL